jgi:hypothetical protein
MVGRHVALGLTAGAFMLATSTYASAQCTGWPVTCTGVPHVPGGGFGSGGMGGAASALGIGFGILNILLDQQMQSGNQAPPGNPPPVTGNDAPTAPNPAARPVTESQKAAILSQIRPVRTGSYAATAPSTASTTSDVESQKLAILNQIRPTTGTSAGGAGSSSGSAQKAAKQSRTQESAEAASANRREPFDSAKPGSTRTAADQLCQAAGNPNNCIGKFGGSRTASAASPGADTAPGAVVLPAGAGAPRVPDQVCGASLPLDRPVKVAGFGLGPRRAAGYPIAHDLDQLRSFDYSDIKANLRASSPEQLAKWTLQARQEIATLETVIDTLKVKLFASELGATVPVKSLSEAAKDALYESVKDAVPFWRQMEALGQRKAEGDVKTAAEHFDAVDKAVLERDIATGKLAKALGGIVEEMPGLLELTRNYATSLLEATVAVDYASKGDKGAASEHAGKAAAALIPMAQWVVPAEALPTLVKSEAWAKVAIIAIEVSARGTEVVMTRSEALDAQAAAQETARELANRVDGLNAKLRDLRNVQQLIAQEPRCN